MPPSVWSELSGDAAATVRGEVHVAPGVVLPAQRDLQGHPGGELGSPSRGVAQAALGRAQAGQAAQIGAERAAGSDAVDADLGARSWASAVTSPRTANFDATYSTPPRPGK